MLVGDRLRAGDRATPQTALRAADLYTLEIGNWESCDNKLAMENLGSLRSHIAL
jgi:hypothetical protein